MPDGLTDLLAYDGLVWLIATVFIAGAVRGFSGFGTALVYLPVAGMFMPPVWALTTLVVMDVFGPIPNLPRARRDGRLADVGRMWLGTIVALPIGLLVLYSVDPGIFRYAVCGIALLVPLLLASGLRLRGQITPALQISTGGIAGFLGGVAGMPGPPVILMHMASTEPAQLIRANIMMYLFAFDATLLSLLGIQGKLELLPILIGLALAVPNLLGNLAGGAMFRPERQRLYRLVGYGITMAAALSGLPIWE
ncbi:sulfite exporter TauE/SafE family protein [Thalassovita sp.]|uniref:sulfite exporter TauE/SafE family protein n=1 Tax=Thalassovita sp. TaxID=1979401 RepID=UPI002B27A46C|nr:sulfite exporter TauE/SafE family protein [Thalassovita sp.]